jgi:peptidoglycan/LPS O-acetylase OafA/YrhL
VWWFIIPVALFFTVIMAMLSWRYVEKPALGHRKLLIGFSDRLGMRITGAFRRG